MRLVLMKWSPELGRLVDIPKSGVGYTPDNPLTPGTNPIQHYANSVT